MSNKGIEELPEKKVNLSSMSERQALLYFQHNSNEDRNIPSEKPNSLLNYHDYYLYKQKKARSQIDRAKLAERAKNHKLAAKEFTLIKKNIYIDRKKYVFTDDDGYVCNCFPRKYTQSEAKKIVESNYAGKTEEELFGCGKSCLNKMVTWECVENVCPCGASCRNRKFQNHEYAEVYPIKTADRGFGLCAGTFLPKGTFVTQYIGEVYSTDSKYGEKKLAEYQDKTCTYLMSLTKNEVIDPTTKGNLARFINHSCEPNCETQKWHVLGELCIGIFTLRDIQEDEELTFNYGFNVWKTTYQKCLCGAPSCRGYLGIVTNSSIKKELRNSICDSCKNKCKPKEQLLVCDECKRVYHKNCAKKGQGNNRNFICYYCIKKTTAKKPQIEDQQQQQQQQTGKTYITTTNTNNTSNTNTNIISTTTNDVNSGISLLSKDKIIKIEDEPIYDDTYEVGDEELVKIKKNLSQLLYCYAKLFWDFKLENSILGTNNKLDIKITGTSKQIENAKKMIKQLIDNKKESNSDFSVKIQVPKIFLRKIIGHQNRNLNSYKSKFNVLIDYDINLMTDDIFSIQESTVIQIKGKENNVKAVEKDIKNYLYNLKILTMFLMPMDYQYIKANICELKTKIDPADVRLRKREFKSERDIQHPFYYISNNNKDIVIIGFDREIEKGEKIIKEHILTQNKLAYNYSLSCLFPSDFRNKINTYINEYKNFINDRKLFINVIPPEYLRKHICLHIEGKWDDVIEIKNILWEKLKNTSIINESSVISKRHNITGFEQYTFNQEHKLVSKNIRNFILEQNPQIKNWDCISIDIEQLKKEQHNKSKQDNINNITSSLDLQLQKQKEETKLIHCFTQSCDVDTKLNYLLNFPVGSYNSIFELSQMELAANLCESLCNTYDSYKSCVTQENVSLHSGDRENYYGSSYYTGNSDNGDISMKDDFGKLKEEIMKDNKKDNGGSHHCLDSGSNVYKSDGDCKDSHSGIIMNISNGNIGGNSILHKNYESRDIIMKSPKRYSSSSSNIHSKCIDNNNKQTQSNSGGNIIMPQLSKTNPLSSLSHILPSSFKEDSNRHSHLSSNTGSNNNNTNTNSNNNERPIQDLNINSQKCNSNISYNFSNINQMNINISINNESKEYHNQKRDQIKQSTTSSSSLQQSLLPKNTISSPSYILPPKTSTSKYSNLPTSKSDSEQKLLSRKSKRSKSPLPQSSTSSRHHTHHSSHYHYKDNSLSNPSSSKYYSSSSLYESKPKRDSPSSSSHNRSRYYYNNYESSSSKYRSSESSRNRRESPSNHIKSRYYYSSSTYEGNRYPSSSYSDVSSRNRRDSPNGSQAKSGSSRYYYH